VVAGHPELLGFHVPPGAGQPTLFIDVFHSFEGQQDNRYVAAAFIAELLAPVAAPIKPGDPVDQDSTVFDPSFSTFCHITPISL
jgi:hypothetical protein